MITFGRREHGIGARRHGEHNQLAVVAGYAWKGLDSVWLYLACGTLPSGLLRYAGRTELRFSSCTQKRTFCQRVLRIRAVRHHPMVASPLPAQLTCLAPGLLAQVTHQGWTDMGTMVAPTFEQFVDREIA